MRVNTVTGPIDSSALGRTLMHEHLQVGFPGWDVDQLAPGRDYRAIADLAVERLQGLKAAGYSSLVDPCPKDLGRDVGLMADVASRTGFNIICATGLYHQLMGAAGHWLMRMEFDPDCDRHLADIFIDEIENGVGDTGIKPGVIKVATAHAPMTDYERMVFRAAAIASQATQTPVMTHTDGIMGDLQVQLLGEGGVGAEQIIVGHTCCSGDHAYHDRLIETGTFLGFDRFGLDVTYPDQERTANLVRLIKAGHTRQLIVSHDSVGCFLGGIAPPEMIAEVLRNSHPLYFHETVRPQLLEMGVSAEAIETMLRENPRRFFESVAR